MDEFQPFPTLTWHATVCYLWRLWSPHPTIKIIVGCGLSSQRQHPREMLCLILSVLPHQCYSSEVDSRKNYSRVHTSNLSEFVSVSVTQHFCSVFGFTSR